MNKDTTDHLEWKMIHSKLTDRPKYKIQECIVVFIPLKMSVCLFTHIKACEHVHTERQVNKCITSYIPSNYASRHPIIILLFVPIKMHTMKKLKKDP